MCTVAMQYFPVLFNLNLVNLVNFSLLMSYLRICLSLYHLLFLLYPVIMPFYVLCKALSIALLLEGAKQTHLPCHNHNVTLTLTLVALGDVVEVLTLHITISSSVLV